MRGLLTFYFTLPLGMVGFALAAYWNRAKAPPRRLRAILLGTAMVLFISLLLRSGGVTGEYAFDLKPRWTPEAGAGQWSTTKTQAAPASVAAAIESAVAKAEWPGFRGADRMGHADAPNLATDWKANPPKLLWKRPVGAGWSSFAVAGSFAFTQEQRGPQEAVGATMGGALR
jgi:outer membrane protein assembly factor BamB